MTKKIKDGPFKKYSDDGKYLYEGKFKNNKRIGTFTVTNTITDVVEEIYTYKNNKLHGPYKKYNSFGKIREDGNYKDGKRHGQWKYYVRDDLILLPNVSPYLFSLLATIVLQLFAFFIAVAKKRNIDQPRNLAKSVTVE